MYVRIFIALAILLLPTSAHAALLYLDPPRATYGPGDVFVVEVRLDNEEECVNAVSVDLSAPTQSLSFVDVSRGTSILSLWTEEPEIDRLRGTVHFSGGIPGGYCGRIEGDPALTNTIATLIMQVPVVAAKGGPYDASIMLAKNSTVLRNDGRGSAVPLSLQNATISIDPKMTSGINEWKGRLDEDTIPPEAFTVSLQSDPGVFDGKYYLIFSTLDKQSGMDYFEVKEGTRIRRATSPYPLNDQTPQGPIEVRAYDKAGNVRVAELSLEGPLAPSPRVASTASTAFGVMLGLLLVLGLFYLYARAHSGTKPEKPAA